MKLSVIDQAPVSSGSTAAQALQNSIELARLADRLGYSRYWVAEHHATELLACSSPEILMTRLAAETSRIRIGSGGVMLPHYAPLKVVENFRMLHALYPGRIDLGIGRAPGGGPLEMFALRRERVERALPDDFPDQLVELLAFLNNEFPPNHPFARIPVTPAMPGAPDVWLLGSSLWSAQAAAQFGLPYAFAHFISAEPTREAIETYKRAFQPSQHLSKPHAIVALGAVCAPTDEEALRLLSSARLVRKRIQSGSRGPVPTIDEAIRELGENATAPLSDNTEWPRYFAGSPQTIRKGLEDLAGALQLDELMIVTIVHEHSARLRSYALLAEEFLRD
jgi:luciferase family oxidoreductase group 1